MFSEEQGGLLLVIRCLGGLCSEMTCCSLSCTELVVLDEAL